MSTTIVIMTVVLLLTFFSPFAVYSAITKAKQKQYKTHRKLQNVIFIICVLGVLALEGLIRAQGGSGSLASESAYYQTSFFKITLYSHIIVAVLSYLVWTVVIILSNSKFQNTLPGTFSKLHKTLGYILLIGLMYTALSAVAVYVMTLNLV